MKRIQISKALLLSVLVFPAALADIHDRIEYKLERVRGETIELINEVNILANDVACINKQLTGIPFAAPINNDGNLYSTVTTDTRVSLSRVSELSRLAPTLSPLRICNIEDFGGIWWRNVENENWIAVNPVNPDNMIVVTTQDLYSVLSRLSTIVLYTIDGGVTWNQADTVLSKCQGPTLPRSTQDFDIADLPTVVFDQAGNAYVVVVSFNNGGDVTGNFDEAIVLIKSTDGGRSWTQPQAITRDDGNSHFIDGTSIWNDQFRENTLYQVADDLPTALGIGNENYVIFSKTDTAGTTWQPYVNAITTIDPFFPEGAQIHVLDDADQTLLLTVKVPGGEFQDAPAQFVVAHSSDVGASWSQATIFDDWTVNAPIDPADGTFFRSFVWHHDCAMNATNGNLYVVAQDGRFAPPGEGGSIITMSTDGGLTWSDPVPVNPGSLSAQAFLPSVAVADDGTVGVLFFDFRFFVDGDLSLKTDVWLALYNSDLSSRFDEIRITPESFDSRQYVRGRRFGTDAYFPGNYCKLQSSGNDFVASFTLTNPPYGIGPSPIPTDVFTVDQRNRQDVLFARLSRP